MAMKESGIEWVGLIPDTWSVIPNKYVMHKEKNLCEKWTGEDVMSLTMNGVIVRDLQNPTGKMPATFDGYQYIEDGDLLMCLFDIDVTPRCVGKVTHDGVTSPAYSNFKVHDNASREYFYYYYLMVDNTKELLHLAKNLRHSFTEEQLGQLKVPMPPLSEQQAIANYLDETCSQIDEIIAEAKASIDEYKNFRQSVISEAVLNGIEQHNYKNVDLEWIASIPDTWGVMPLKRYFTYQKGLPITKADLLENGDKVISYGQIHAKFNTGVTVDERLIRYVSHEYSLSNSESLCSKGDIILADTSEDKDGCGNAVYIDKDEMIFAGYHTIILKSNVDNKYLAYLFTSNKWRSQIRKRVQGVKLFSVTLKILNQCSIILPPVNEQIDIVKYLDEKTAIIDACISEKESLINDLEAYKKSLIFEVVTGKRRVV